MGPCPFYSDSYFHSIPPWPRTVLSSARPFSNVPEEALFSRIKYPSEAFQGLNPLRSHRYFFFVERDYQVRVVFSPPQISLCGVLRAMIRRCEVRFSLFFFTTLFALEAMSFVARVFRLRGLASLDAFFFLPTDSFGCQWPGLAPLFLCPPFFRYQRPLLLLSLGV